MHGSNYIPCYVVQHVPVRALIFVKEMFHQTLYKQNPMRSLSSHYEFATLEGQALRWLYYASTVPKAD